MRAFAVISFAVAALAAPAALAPGSVATVIAPITAPVKAVVGAVTGVGANVDAAIANADVQYNNIANNDLNNNDIDVLRRSVNVNNVGAKNIPVKANADNAEVHAITHDYEVGKRALVDVLTVVTAILQALVQLCTQLGVNVNAAIANLNISNNNILNNVLNGNNVNVASKREVANVVGQVVAAIFAVVQSALKAGVNVNALIANVQATCNNIANNVGNGNNVNVASRGLVTAILPIAAFINAFVVAVTHVCVGLTAEILNVALNYNNIANSVLNNNSINVLSGL